MADPSTVDPADCPEPFWHKMHHYCPCCSWVDPERARETKPVSEEFALRAKLAAAEAQIETERRFRMGLPALSQGGSAVNLNEPRWETFPLHARCEAELDALRAKLAAMEAVVEEVPEALRVGAMMGVRMEPLRKAWRDYADVLSPKETPQP